MTSESSLVTPAINVTEFTLADIKPGSSGAHKFYEAGEIIMSQNDFGDCAYIIGEGLVEIFVERPDGSLHKVGTRGPGAIVGEMAIVDEAPRTATVKAVEDCKMLVITREDFAQRLNTADPVIQMITQVILTRYRDMLMRVEVMSESASGPPPEVVEREHAAQTDVVKSIKMANEFKAALENQDLSMYYQPLIDLSTGDIVGFEGLMRWIHPEQGFISPGVFIPVAEKSGLIVEATKWSVRECCEALHRIEKATNAKAPLAMSINFTSHDFASEGFVENTLKAISDAKVDPSQIKIEITERILMENPDHARKTLDACKEAGAKIAIDDFGTGYSSLNYLYYFPIDILKIDQSFIRIMHDDTRCRELVRSIVGLGKNLQLSVVAEGIEAQEDAELLQDMGCDWAQGFYFAKPMPEDQVIHLLSEWDKKTA